MMSPHASPPKRPTGPVSDWWSPNHTPPSKLAKEPPVTSEQPLWRLSKGDHTAEARVRPIEGFGIELRYMWNGDLRMSQVFKTWPELEAAASEKRRDLEARGWQSQ